MMSADGQRGFVGIDVDSLHHYYVGKTQRMGNEERATKNAVYEWAIPRYLELLADLQIRGTFFVVAQDAKEALVKKRVREILANGHEVASHSYSHPQNFLSLSPKRKEEEIVRAEQVLCEITGTDLVGFRAPAWGIDEQAMDVLEARGYYYDSSIMPSLLLPMLKIGYFLHSRGKIKPGDLLGKCQYSMAPLEPYFPAFSRIERRGTRQILELPITVIPLGRLPFWATIHLLVGTWLFFLFEYRLLGSRSAYVNYQCHGVDLLDLERDAVPSAFRHMFGLRHPLARRAQLLKRILARLMQDYDLVPAREWVSRAWPASVARRRSGASHSPGANPGILGLPS